MPPRHNKQAWFQYHKPIDRTRRVQHDPRNLLTAMCTTAVAYGFQHNPQNTDDQAPTALGDMLHALRHEKQYLATLLHTDTPHTRHNIQDFRERIAHI